ncbi:hypothetical protein M1558_01690 [Candidatus Parvarchaeota archaeon]|nr:hypothetical protein [Candidatus Parvarchaeota archaeon]
MVEADTKKSGLDEVLGAIFKIGSGETKLSEKSSISEKIITGNSGDIKINKMEIYSNLKYFNLSDYYVLISASNGKKYEPVLYFTKKAYLNKEALEKQKPDLNLIGNGLIFPLFSNDIQDYYLSKSMEYKFEIKYLKKGDWIEDIMKFAQITEDSNCNLQDIFDAWNNNGKV